MKLLIQDEFKLDNLEQKSILILADEKNVFFDVKYYLSYLDNLYGEV